MALATLTASPLWESLRFLATLSSMWHTAGSTESLNWPKTQGRPTRRRVSIVCYSIIKMGGVNRLMVALDVVVAASVDLADLLEEVLLATGRVAEVDDVI